MANHANTSKSRSDDRNLVDISTDQQAVTTLEDRLYLLWNKHGRLIIALIVLLVLLVIGYFVLQSQQAAREIAIQEEFQVANTPELQQQFASRYPKHPLTGVIWKTFGDQAYQQKDFEAAAQYLKQAAETLPGIVGAQAQLGYGVSLLQIPQQEETGVRTLQSIGDNPNSYPSLAAEAFWQLAIHALSKGNIQEVNQYLDKTAQKDIDLVFSREIQALRATLPSDS